MGDRGERQPNARNHAGAVRRAPASPGRDLIGRRKEELVLDHDVAAPRAARRFVASVLDEWGVQAEPCERSLLMVSELISNAVLHGGRGPIRLVLGDQAPGDAAIRIEVYNDGEGQAVMRQVQADELSGRGLHLIDDLASAWGTTSGGGQTLVWFDVRVDHGPGQRALLD